MIKSFNSKETERIWKGEPSRKLPADIQGKARMKLRMINNSASLNDLRIPPSNHLESLRGDRKGRYSIRINNQWRICFIWNEGNAYHVEIVDYH
ncbi:MAG: type II toxin-antitoxin system RelE/ParE family toxin [Spirochaetes bacterium]|nr:type II toxin-antitoxin system RelE/ParE family toxin [Spirochaetota bacterium]